MSMIRHSATPSIVMAGLVPAIHGLFPVGRDAGFGRVMNKKDVDGRHKAGHDAWGLGARLRRPGA